MLYQRVFSTYPNINFIFAHCGGALPVLTGRVALLGAETWVRNPNGVTSEEFRSQIASLWFDTAATAETGLQPAAKVAGIEHCGMYRSFVSPHNVVSMDARNVLPCWNALRFDHLIISDYQITA